jgi:hypothetical protein
MLVRGFSCNYLPAYSPFFNSIENMFSLWKSYLRALEPKTEEELMEGIANFQLLPGQANNYCAHALGNSIRCIAGQDMLN